MPRLAPKLVIAALIAMVGTLAVAGVVYAKTYRLSASKSKLAFNVKTIRAGKGSVTLSMANPSSLPHGIGIKGHGKNVKGKTVKVALNGKTVIAGATIPDLPARGRIALQHHGSKNKQGEWAGPPSLVQFKNIAIKELK